MKSQSKEKRSQSIKYIALGSLVAFSTTLTGCTKAPSISQSNQDRDKDKEENNSSGGGHFSGGGHGGSFHTPLTASRTPKPAVGTVSRGWFGGFHFSGG